ncbi:hypothetical protein [Novosphingobium decolorationis]|nr:hypothetical protein [Novosphingobium decolorationis]
MRTDLQMAIDFIGTMEGLRDRATTAQVASADENAFLGLLYSSIYLYARVTKTSSKHRKYRFNFLKEYADDEVAKHLMLCELRDNALAHFGPGEIHGGKVFHSDGVFLMLNPDGSTQVVTLSSRVVIQPRLIDTLRQMTQRALTLIGDHTQKLNAQVTSALNHEAGESTELSQLAQNHFTDLATFAGSEGAARDILEGSRSGYRRGSARS